MSHIANAPYSVVSKVQVFQLWNQLHALNLSNSIQALITNVDTKVEASQVRAPSDGDYSANLTVY